VRELVLRCPLVNAELVEHKMSIARAIGEWLGLGGFSPELTPLDHAAHTERLERVNFQDTLLMRVWRGWSVERVSESNGRALFAVDEPEDRQTIWATSQLLSLPGTDDPRIAQAFMRQIVDGIWASQQADTGKRWLFRRREDLPEGDILLITSNEEEARGQALRRVSWIRYAVRDDWMILAPIHLVTAQKFLAEPAQIETEAMMDREVRNALLMPPPAEQE